MFRTLEEITANGYCMGCGLCTQLAPNALEMRLTDQGQLQPSPTRALSTEEQAAIVRLCPGVSLEAPMRPGDDPVWGTALRVCEGWSGDPEERFQASAGGVMTAINRYLLESGRVSFVLQIRPGGADALSSEPVFVRDPAELLAGAQSRYASSAPLTALQAAIDTGERFAISLKPCDVAGVANFRREAPEAARRIVFTQAMFCGTVPSRDSSWDFLRRRDIDPLKDPPETFRWRGNGCPGPTVATMPDGRTFAGVYSEMWNDNPWTTGFRCKVCPDAIGLHADLATGDFWDGATPTGESPGENGVIAHTEIALEILEACEADGRLVLRDTPIEALNRTQPHHQRLRQTWPARVAGAFAAGAPAPDFRNLATAASARPPAALAETFQGALERARRLPATEPTAFEAWAVLGEGEGDAE